MTVVVVHTDSASLVLQGSATSPTAHGPRLDPTIDAGSGAQKSLANLQMKFKTVRTLRGLLIPGWLTAEYLAGRRQLYLTPFKVYLVCAALFFLSAPLAGFRLGSLIESDRSGTVARLASARVADNDPGRPLFNALPTCACDRCIRLHSALSPSCLPRCLSGSFGDRATCTARI